MSKEVVTYVAVNQAYKNMRLVRAATWLLTIAFSLVFVAWYIIHRFNFGQLAIIEEQPKKEGKEHGVSRKPKRIDHDAVADATLAE